MKIVTNDKLLPLRATPETNMVEERWEVTHQGIALDCARKLVDGQHRLAAVIADNLRSQA